MLRDLALEAVGQISTRASGEKACDLAVDVPLARRHDGVEDAPEHAGFPWNVELGMDCGASERAKVLVTWEVAHDRSPEVSCIARVE
jgi:hypothetical protein